MSDIADVFHLNLKALAVGNTGESSLLELVDPDEYLHFCLDFGHCGSIELRAKVQIRGDLIELVDFIPIPSEYHS